MGIYEGSESMGKFAKRMKAMGDGVVKNSEDLLRKTFIAIGGAVIPATPVDTGHARNNWLSSTGTALKGAPNSAEKSGQAAVVQNINTGVALKVTDEAVLVNNVPYIRRLNTGHSKQAPAGFIEKAVAAGVATVKGFKLT